MTDKKQLRIALAGISHETNTYCQGQTPKADFYTLRGAKMLASAGQESDVGGAVDACVSQGFEPVPVLFASTQPSGTIAREAYEEFKEEILTGLTAAAPLDGCVLLLHGAGVVDGIEDLEGDLAQAVREVLGDIPITATFDLHGNATQFMADQLNGIFVCRQYPHIDLHLRAADAVAAILDMLERGVNATCHLLSLPILLPTTTTFEGVGEATLADLLDLQARTPCVDLSWFHGFPYTDVAHVGSSVVATCYPEQLEQAQVAIASFAQQLWDGREQFRARSLDAQQALAEAQQCDSFPVVIHETSDNCGGGSPGDGTHLLRAMLDAGLGNEACFAFLVDAETATQAHKAGVGSSIAIRLGGKTDQLHGEPVETTAYVKALHDGRLIMQHMFRGAPINIGPMARLVIDDMDVVVSSRRSQTFDREPFLAVGIDVHRYKYVTLKSSNHFRAGFQHLASQIVTADTPGLTTHQIEIFPRQKTKRRLWPIDSQASYP
ncbi:MAG: M81 family metallopeptidase [Pseudomonadaceae bacterium]|nr:M81 family metallopeptidase [Pseudomonadaceae bacterium]